MFLLSFLSGAASCGDAPKRAAELDRAAAGDTTTRGSAPTGTPRSDTADWVLTERGLGPLRAGMTLAEATSALRGALVLEPGADSSECAYAQWRGGPAGVLVMVEGSQIARVDVETAGIRTAAGIGVGGTESAVQRAYGRRAEVTPHKYEDGHYLTVIDAADTTFALVFETSDGTVRRFRGGRRPQVEYVEGCS